MATIRLPALYKRTTQGKIQVWYVEFEGPRYRMISGKLDGKMVTSNWTTAKPKNVGRSNATTAEQQAELEARAEYEKKLRDGYSKTPEAAAASTTFFPMLAPTDAYDDTPALQKKVYAALRRDDLIWDQPKLDGVRCVAKTSGLWSRKNRPFYATPHIEVSVAPILEAYPHLILDGEFYNHDLWDDFDKIVSLVRPTKPTDEDLMESAAWIDYWLFDVYDLKDPKRPYRERLQLLDTLLAEFADPRLVPVPTYVSGSLDELNRHYQIHLEEKFEGQMIRTNGPYEPGKRSPLLIKRKEFEDQEYTCIDICEGTGNRAGKAGYAVFQLDAHRTFKADIKGNDAFRIKLLEERDKYIGATVTVKRFKQLTPDGVPRFPKVETKAWYVGGRDV